VSAAEIAAVSHGVLIAPRLHARYDSPTREIGTGCGTKLGRTAGFKPSRHTASASASGGALPSRERTSSARGPATQLSASVPMEVPRRPLWKIFVPIGALLLVTLTGALFFRSSRAHVITEKDSILLADFVNTTAMRFSTGRSRKRWLSTCSSPLLERHLGRTGRARRWP